MRKLKAFLLSAFLLASVFTFANGQGEGDTIKIGAIMPISGPISTYGITTRDGIQMAVDEYNAAGGVLGHQIELIVEDNKLDAGETVTAFKKLVDQDEVVGLVGALASSMTLSIVDLAQESQIPMITPTSTNDTVTSAGDYIFRACYSDSFQGSVVAQFAAEDLKTMKAAILFDVANDYSVGLAKNFTAKFESLGGTIVASESYATGDKDFNAQITKIKAQNPDVLFLPDYYSTVALITKQVESAGLDVPMLGADGWDTITDSAGDEIIGSYYSNHYSPESDDADVRSFVDKYTEAYGETPNALAALGYDAAQILIEAIKRAGSTDPEAIKKEIAATNAKFVTGNISFTSIGDTIKSAVMVEIVKKDGALTTSYAGTVNP
ncbi:ABC transporter substrate-binding protein [Spirochaeta cellobiosiphila]|uniref:ABC transporter substrate-binding protein n=1 Tax=Spirochaeta cellobiosiphila TaxID=504483 RepID=UPI000406DE32|nr:ABC transporter substrate-binding protein [Spirochaeta cellobiosiphila]